MALCIVWEAAQFKIYHLRTESPDNPDNPDKKESKDDIELFSGYELLTTSKLLPNCDLKLLASYVKPDQQFEAVLAYQEQLRSA
ncbi:hypothetical protein [Thalassoporum mexicanum]|uniref:hypothetical protein n=1 Tax=Thalassoporum mexicanum TaxID=3457544 RepID=UPI0012EAF36E|nr:hypothetical protein [Pseudanabaena sp. PCC 7367]